MKLLGFLKDRFSQGAAFLTLLTFLSYLTGYARDKIFAHSFGAGRELDLYNASFVVPDLLLNILVSSALSAAFIPLFSSLFTQGHKKEADELANTVINGAFFVIAIATTAAAIFMPLFVRNFIAKEPGFSHAEQDALISLSRMMLISPLIMAISNSLGAILVSYKSFLAYGLSPIFYNAGIIIGTFTVPYLGIHGLVLGTLIGGVLHSLPRIIALRKSAFSYALKLNIKSAHFIKVIKLMIPKMIGHPVEHVTFLVFTSVAAQLAAGSITAMNYARNFQSVPVSLFGIAFSTAVYPVLSQYAGTDREHFLKNFFKALRSILLFTIPSAIGLYLLSNFAIRVLLGGGKFSSENIALTAGVLSVFAFSIPTESLVHLLARSFYSFKNTITPVALSVIGLAISTSFAYLRASDIGIMAIPYGFFLGSFTEVILLGLLLRRKLASLHVIASPQ